MSEKKITLDERLARYPHIRARFEAILNVAENCSGSLDRADDAEARLVEEIVKWAKK